MINPNQRIVIHGLGNIALQPMLESTQNLLKLVESEDSEDLILESVTLEEIEHVYLGNSDFIPADSAMFEAISTQRQQLATTMRAFTRVLNRGLQGTDISGGVENAPDGDDSGTVVGGALIGKVRRIAGVPVIAAKIPLSDGQSTSIIFHSPTSNGKTLVNSDLLVAFQFLVNKRDVTHVVAPIGGKDVSLAQVAQSLSNLIEKNSGKFQKQQAMQKKMKDDIDALQNEADKLENERSTVMQQFNDAQNQATQVSSQVSSLSDQLAKQKSINSDLQKQLDSLQNAPAPAPSQAVTDNLRNIKQSINIDGKATLSDGSTINVKTVGDGTYAILQTPAGDTYQLEAKDIQGASVNDAVGKLFKAYRAGKADKYKVDKAAGAVSDTPPPTPDPEPTPEPTPEPEPTPAPDNQPQGFRYALVNRPAGIGAVPDGQIAILPKDESDPYSQYARNGVIVYPQKLSEEQMSQYELKYLPTQAEYPQYAEQLAQGALSEYAEQYIELAKDDANTFTKNVSLQFKKAFPNVAYPLGDDVNVFMTDVIAALTDVAKPDDAQQGEGSEGTGDNEPDPMDVTQANIAEIANLTGSSVDAVDSWWTANGSGNSALIELKDALITAPSPQNIEALKSAIDFGTAFTAGDVKAMTEPEPEPAPTPEPEPQPEPGTEKTEDNEVPELDKRSNDAIAALKALLTYQSDDTKAIGEKLQEAQNAAQALVEAGTYEDNEILVNDVANNLIQLMAEIQKKGA